MALDLARIRKGFADTVTIPGLSVYGQVLGAPKLPCLMLAASSSADAYVTYHETFGDRALGLLEFDAVLIVPVRNTIDDTLAWVDEFVSTDCATSVLDAIERDREWGGSIDDCMVRHAGRPTPVTSTEGVDAVSVVFPILALRSRG
jgi:hypothetical protein